VNSPSVIDGTHGDYSVIEFIAGERGPRAPMSLSQAATLNASNTP